MYISKYVFSRTVLDLDIALYTKVFYKLTTYTLYMFTGTEILGKNECALI